MQLCCLCIFSFLFFTDWQNSYAAYLHVRARSPKGKERFEVRRYPNRLSQLRACQLAIKWRLHLCMSTQRPRRERVNSRAFSLQPYLNYCYYSCLCIYVCVYTLANLSCLCICLCIYDCLNVKHKYNVQITKYSLDYD